MDCGEKVKFGGEKKFIRWGHAALTARRPRISGAFMTRHSLHDQARAHFTLCSVTLQ
jgi:hypothetical protein